MSSDPGNKFLFDLNHFDEESLEREKQKEPPPPVFSLEDMEEARKTAFDKGKAEGLSEAKQSIEKRIEIVLQSLVANIADLEKAEDARNKRYIDDSVVMIHRALAAVLPFAIAQLATDELTTAIKDFFKTSKMRDDFVLYVHDDMLASMQERLEKTCAGVQIKAKDGIAISQARLEWAHGGASWDYTRTTEQILDIVKEYLPKGVDGLDDLAKTPHNDESNTTQETT